MGTIVTIGILVALVIVAMWLESTAAITPTRGGGGRRQE